MSALWTDEASPRLIGGRDPASGRIVFPCADGFDPVPLKRSGTIWSWTVQRFPPKSPPYAGPAPFEPFALGYVELADEVIVEARFDGLDFGSLKVGLPVSLRIIPFGTGATFAFGPAS
ncbi:MAG: Zn-ribbon domain-containing OB-fold protein [Polymorphobacter sp.]